MLERIAAAGCRKQKERDAKNKVAVGVQAGCNACIMSPWWATTVPGATPPCQMVSQSSAIREPRSASFRKIGMSRRHGPPACGIFWRLPKWRFGFCLTLDLDLELHSGVVRVGYSYVGYLLFNAETLSFTFNICRECNYSYRCYSVVVPYNSVVVSQYYMSTLTHMLCRVLWYWLYDSSRNYITLLSVPLLTHTVSNL